MIVEITCALAGAAVGLAVFLPLVASHAWWERRRESRRPYRIRLRVNFSAGGKTFAGPWRDENYRERLEREVAEGNARYEAAIPHLEPLWIEEQRAPAF